MKADLVSNKVIGCAIEVHRELGPGLLESAYEHCLAYELGCQSISFQQQLPVPITYKGHTLDSDYRIDLLVDSCVVVELKCVAEITQVHIAQLMTYLKLVKAPIGLILNFKVSLLRDGIKRVVMSEFDRR